MRAVTIKHAKAHLNELVEAATRGEQVVLMRGSSHVATIVPISARDLELAPRLSDEQAARFWEGIEREREAGMIRKLPSMERAVASLSRAPTGAPRKRPKGEPRAKR